MNENNAHFTTIVTPNANEAQRKHDRKWHEYQMVHHPGCPGCKTFGPLPNRSEPHPDIVALHERGEPDHVHAWAIWCDAPNPIDCDHRRDGIRCVHCHEKG